MRKRLFKSTIALCMILCLMLSYGCQGSSEDYEKPFKETGENLYSLAESPVPGSIGGEWAVIGLARSDFDVSDDYFAKYIDNTADYVKQCKGVLNTKTGYKYTEYSRIILGITAAGGDVTDIGGYNFLEKLTDMDDVCRQGSNGPIWALIAYDSGAYEIPKDKDANVQTTREALIRAILEEQLDDGGWNIAGGSADADMTAMALQALAPYYLGTGAKIDQVSDKLIGKVKTAVDQGLEAISNLQEEDGTFVSMGEKSSESSCQVIVALSALQIDLEKDDRFIKGDNTVMDALLTYYDEEGGFYHTDGEASANQMATEQAYYAMTAYQRFKNGQSALYDMTK